MSILSILKGIKHCSENKQVELFRSSVLPMRMGGEGMIQEVVNGVSNNQYEKLFRRTC